jgi:hypothetical protein
MLQSCRASALGLAVDSCEVRLPGRLFWERVGVVGADSEPMNLNGVALAGCPARTPARTHTHQGICTGHRGAAGRHGHYNYMLRPVIAHAVGGSPLTDESVTAAKCSVGSLREPLVVAKPVPA